ncbi:MAG: cupin domain-containing protein [Planctomycetota bacterium]
MSDAARHDESEGRGSAESGPVQSGPAQSGPAELGPVDLDAAFERIPEYWSPRYLAELNGQQVRAARLLGEFIWHHHEDEDELFLVLEGELEIHLRDRVVTIAAGQLFVVPRGVEHKPVAHVETRVLLFEPAATLHTGNVRDERTVDRIQPL